MAPTTPFEPSGSWDSIHVFETAERGRQAHYKLTSTVMLQLVTRKGSEGEGSPPIAADRKGTESWKRNGEVSLSGSMTRQASFIPSLCAGTLILLLRPQTEQDWPIHDASSHITNTGKMIEEMEIKMRNLLQEVKLSFALFQMTVSDVLRIRCTLARLGTSFTTCAVWMILRKRGDRRNYKKNLSVLSNGNTRRC